MIMFRTLENYDFDIVSSFVLRISNFYSVESVLMHSNSKMLEFLR